MDWSGLQPDRRRLLLGAGVAALAPRVTWAQAVFSETPFRLGVASGDPAPDGFVIWTRLAPRPLEPHGGMPMTPVAVQYEVAADDQFKTVVAKGESIARPELAHSVHLEVAGLSPNRPYWYRFIIGRERSNVGRARTLPAADAALDHLRFVAAGCQNYQDGYFTAYRRIAEEDLDFVWHYGDYIYEARARLTAVDGAGLPIAPVRSHVGDEPFSLDDYRTRYAQYKLDPDLQAAHAAHSWWVTWDDHEIVNDWAGNHDVQDGAPPEVFDLRRQAAAQAYYEHMPLRASAFPHGPLIQIYRHAQYGQLLSTFFLDTRQFRQPQPCGDGLKAICAEARRTDARIMNPEQEAWLFDGLSQGGGWKLIANQIMMMPLDRQLDAAGPPLQSMDTWSGYASARDRLLAHLQDGAIRNVVVATGDEHQNFAGELRHGGQAGPSVAVEFVATSISSGGDGHDQRPGTDVILRKNPHVQFMNDRRGYIVCDVTPQTWTTHYRVLDKVTTPNGQLTTTASFAIQRDKPGLDRV